MKAIIVDDDYRSLEKRAKFFLQWHDDGYVPHRECAFRDLTVVATPLFPSRNLIEDLRETFKAAPVEIWADEQLFHSRAAFVEHFEKHVQLRDLILWDYHLGQVPWAKEDQTASIHVLSEIRRRRPTHAIIWTRDQFVVNVKTIEEFRRYFTSDEFMAEGFNADPVKLRQYFRDIQNASPDWVTVWAGETGGPFEQFPIERKEVEFRRRYADWCIDENTGVFETKRHLMKPSPRPSPSNCATLCELILNPEGIESDPSDSRAANAKAQRISGIRSWLADAGEADAIPRMTDNRYRIESGITVLIVPKKQPATL